MDTAESACELGKTGGITRAETVGLNPATEPFRPGAGAEAEGQWADAAHEERQKFSNWISQMLADVAAEAGVRTAVVVVYVWCCLQADSSEVTEDGTGGRSDSMLAAGVVADTGAKVRGLGKKHVHSARDVRDIAETVGIEGAGGTVEIDTVGDLEMTGHLNGTMDGAMVFYDCAEPVMPVVPVCEEKDTGFQTGQSGGRCRFYKDGCTVQELDKEGQLFTAPVHGRCEPDAWHECDSGTDLQWGMIAECEGTGDFILDMEATERHGMATSWCGVQCG